MKLLSAGKFTALTGSVASSYVGPRPDWVLCTNKTRTYKTLYKRIKMHQDVDEWRYQTLLGNIECIAYCTIERDTYRYAFEMYIVIQYR